MTLKLLAIVYDVLNFVLSNFSWQVSAQSNKDNDADRTDILWFSWDVKL